MEFIVGGHVAKRGYRQSRRPPIDWMVSASIGTGRMLKANIETSRTHSAVRQGWQSCLVPSMKQELVERLVQRLGECVLRHTCLCPRIQSGISGWLRD